MSFERSISIPHRHVLRSIMKLFVHTQRAPFASISIPLLHWVLAAARENTYKKVSPISIFSFAFLLLFQQEKALYNAKRHIINDQKRGSVARCSQAPSEIDLKKLCQEELKKAKIKRNKKFKSLSNIFINHYSHHRRHKHCRHIIIAWWTAAAAVAEKL